jgi:pyruvate kinase
MCVADRWIRSDAGPVPARLSVTCLRVAQASADLYSPLIVCLTETGSSARFVAKYKPAVPVVTLTPDEQTARQCLVRREAAHPLSRSRVAARM